MGEYIIRVALEPDNLQKLDDEATTVEHLEIIENDHFVQTKTLESCMLDYIYEDEHLRF